MYSSKVGVGMAVCNKGRDDGIKKQTQDVADFSRLPFVKLFKCACHGIKHKVKHTAQPVHLFHVNCNSSPMSAPSKRSDVLA